VLLMKQELMKQFFLSNDTAVAGKPHKEVQFDKQNSFSGDRRVLVIDDDKRARVALCEMLEHLSFKVEYVGKVLRQPNAINKLNALLI